MALLDPYLSPSPDPGVLAERRELLRDQLAWLMDEAAALGPLLAELPEWALAQSAVEGERSVKESLARIAALDAGPRAGHVRAFAGDAPQRLDVAEPAVDPALLAGDVPVILEAVRSARAALLQVLDAIPAEQWEAEVNLGEEIVTLYDVALRIAREDADELRALAYRLHAGVGGRP